MSIIDPIPSSPRRPPTHEIRAELDTRAFYLWTYVGITAPKHVADFFINGEPCSWIDDTSIKTSSGIILRSPQMSEIIDHELTSAEEEYSLPPNTVSDIQTIICLAKGEIDNIISPIADDQKPRNRRERTVSDRNKTRAPRPSKAGLTTVSDIAKQMGIEAFDARQSLRSQKIEKPAHGWAWPTSDVDAIIEIIKKGLKK